MKREMKIVVMCFLFILILAGMKNQRVYAEELKVAKSGDVESMDGEKPVDVEGNMTSPTQGGSTIATSATSTTTSRTTPTTNIGGKLVDTSGKNVRTGDVLTSARTLAILFLGMGCMFLIMKKKNDKESVRE